MVLRVLALNTEGRMTYCTVPPERRGTGRCNHLSHQGGSESAGEYRTRAEQEHGSIDLFRRSVDEFRFALEVLDNELESLSLPEPVKVNAVGGFALMAHGLRESGYTVDIDTITNTYPSKVRDAINKVAEELSLERDWINNEASGDDPELVENMLDAVYLPYDFGLSNITIQIADLPTLTRAKAFAVSDAALSGRDRDLDDLIDLLERQNIDSVKSFRRHFPEVREWEYPGTYQALEAFFSTGSRDLHVVEEDLDMDELLREIEENGW